VNATVIARGVTLIKKASKAGSAEVAAKKSGAGEIIGETYDQPGPRPGRNDGDLGAIGSKHKDLRERPSG
jgi:hypothetical protein